MKQEKESNSITIGLDLGGSPAPVCVLNGEGEVLEEGSLLNDRASLEKFSGRYGGALAVMEAGCHSPWISRCLERLGCRVPSHGSRCSQPLAVPMLAKMH
jgi:hypothetical protein